MPRAELDEILIPGESPYFAMFRAGCLGYTIEECTDYCMVNNIPLRAKDIQNWEDGHFKNQIRDEIFKRKRKELMAKPGYYINPFPPSVDMGNVEATASRFNAEVKRKMEDVKFEDLPKLPDGWKGTEHRFFPCTKDNKPMMSWGWRDGFEPNLMLRADAKAISPCGWVGQNMLYQPFIVMDIDGVGHGCVDEKVIQFGMQFKDKTLTCEDPNKVGSFHLYFKTDRLVPVKHFPHAKLDLMGNAVNAAVYFKNKVNNGVPMLELTANIWNVMMEYQKKRKEQ